MKTAMISICMPAFLILGYIIWPWTSEDTSKNKWIISSSPTTIIWSKEDLTQKNLQAEEPKCGIGLNVHTGEIYECVNYVDVTIDDTLDFTNVDPSTVALFTNYGYRDKQEINAIEAWIKISYRAVNEDNFVYMERKGKP